ncbi:hypothetical protein FKW77_010315 [Venturia effusa]|uniref:DNA-directed RNA polymerase subunit n=1 Tax=Venturia effusa TaxID=50376 RepID=A0A517KXN4_9PEZI|nr:hypothetical protein FKW77_010315 [Venturia effusa]
MFFYKEEERTINLHPSFFGPNITKYLDDQLLGDVEGTLQGDYFVVCVMQPHEYSDGKIVPGSSFAEFVVHYRAIVWKPFKGEVVDAQVTGVADNGFFCEIGPLKVFVSKSMIPSDIKYDGHATPPQWTDGADQTIEKGTQIRLKIKGMRTDMGSLYAIGTIKEDYLGVTEVTG